MDAGVIQIREPLVKQHKAMKGARQPLERVKAPQALDQEPRPRPLKRRPQHLLQGRTPFLLSSGCDELFFLGMY